MAGVAGQSGWVLAVLLTLISHHSTCGLTVSAFFNQRGVSGFVNFTHAQPSDPLSLSVLLQGLDQPTFHLLEWAVHVLPFPPSIPEPCQSAVGPLYHNLTATALTASGDLQQFSLSDLSLFGTESIVGRSLLLRVNETVSVCANIGYPDDEGALLWAPLRAAVSTGNVFLRQHSNEAIASAYVSMTTTSPTPLLEWAILTSADSTCDSSGTPYNPGSVDPGACSQDNQSQCAVGDLSGRNGALEVQEGAVRLFLTDSLLPLASLQGRPLAVGVMGGSSCASLQSYQPLRVEAQVEGGGVSGRVEFSQLSPTEQTQVIVSGLEGEEYAVHYLPPGAGGDCSIVGEIFDPRGVGSDLRGDTADFYPFGDLSGKFEDSAMYSDPYLPLSGRDSIVGRSLVVRRNGELSGCGLIRYAGAEVQVSVSFSVSGFSGTITFTQPGGNPFADTIITIETNITADVELFPSTTSTLTSTPSLTFPAPSTPSLTFPAPSTPSLTFPAPSTPSLIFPPPSTPSLIFPAPSTPSPVFVTATGIPSQSEIPPSPSTPVTPELSPETSFPSLLLPFPSSTPLGPVGSGSDESSILLPLQTMSMGRRRRREVVRRETTAAAEFSWSLRQTAGDSVPTDCSQLEVVGSSAGGCSPSSPLSCAAGDLTGKHGPLPFGAHTSVFSDPYLPLSGPDGVVSAVLLVEPANGVGPSLCAVVTMVTSAMPTPTPLSSRQPVQSSTPSAPSTASSTTAAPTSPGKPSSGADNTVILIGAVVGGVVVAAVLVTLVLVLVCLCAHRLRRRRHQVDIHKAGKEDKGGIELGHIRPHVEPQIGSDQYHVLYNYQPQNADDLGLEKGEWVTLLEAPYGGEWWRGRVDKREGWFPKSYVEYVDKEEERRKTEEENFKLAAAAIVAAGSSFSQRHGSLATSKTRRTRTPTNTRRTTTFSKSDIDSTPKMTAKFATHAPQDSVVIGNDRNVSVSTAGSSSPDTPRSLAGSDVITNHVTMEAVTMENEKSQESSYSNLMESGMNFEPYVVRFNYVGGTEIELPLTKGERVNVLEKEDNGWWQGVCGGRVGWFPASYVKPAGVKKQLTVQEGGPGREETGPRGMAESLQSDTLEATEYRAVHTFSSEQEGDLQFTEGDSVFVYWAHDNGWWYGARGSTQGWFPGTYVEPSEEPSEAGSMATSPVPLSQETAVHEAAGMQQREGGEGGEGITVMGEVAQTKPSPERRSRRKKWSFKRKRESSLDGQAEGGDVPLIAGSEVKGETSPPKKRKHSSEQTIPRRKAPPPPVQATPPKATAPISHSPLPTTAQATPPATGSTSTTSSEKAQQPVAQQRKRRTTASGVDPIKPRRLPPPPPSPATLTPLTSPIQTALPPTIPEAPAEKVDGGAMEKEAATGKQPPSASATPIPPPRRKVKRVKRPVTRLIPPPPSAPLPPPPIRKTAPSPVVQEKASRPAKEAAAPERVPVAPAGTEPSKEGRDEMREEGKQPPSIRSKPPVKPKPAPLPKMAKTHSEPSLGLAAVSPRLTSPPVAPDSPKPPPPARSSSLSAPHPIPARRRLSGPTLSIIPGSIEETDSPPTIESVPEVQETSEEVHNLRSPPPQHPPPPRPRTAEEDSAQIQSAMKRRSNPPSFPPPQRPDQSTGSDTGQPVATPAEISVSRSSSIKAKGTQLMRSLKKIVRRSEPREDEGEVIENLQTESPKPKRKPPTQAETTRPARPPPPHITRQPSGSRSQDKVTPSRPPPPRKQPSTTTPTPSSQQPPTDPPREAAGSPTHLPSLTTAAVPSPVPSPVHSASSASSPSHSASPEVPTNFYRAKEDYSAQTPSELTLHAGDILIEIDRPTPAMHYGMLDDGTTGLYPASAVEPLLAPSK